MASCALCKSFGMTKVQYNYDLAKEHVKIHFLQSKIIADGIDIGPTFDICFHDFASSANVRTRSKDAGCPNLTALCHSLFDGKFTTSTPHIICEQCGLEIKIINQGVVKPNRIIEHVCYHLNLNMYECRHCMQELRSRSSITKHMQITHQLHTTIGHFQNRADDFVEEISKMIKSCFGGMKKRHSSGGATFKAASMSKVRSFTKGSQLAVERQLLCYRIIQKRMDRNGHVQCRLCSKGIKVTGSRGSQSNCGPIREHAYRHLPTPLYRCRLCSEASFGMSDIFMHLKSAHALPCLEHNYECLADQYHSDVLAMMNKCYGEESDSSKKIMCRNLTDPKVCQKSTRTKLEVRRQLLCHRLIRKCATAEGHVQCRLCSKKLRAKSRNSLHCQPQALLQHALLHVGKKLYNCTKCSDSFVYRSAVEKHLQKVHALTLRQAYFQCSADQFHGDIVRILRQCFGAEEISEEDDESGEVPSSDNHGSNESMSVVPSKLTIERQTLCLQLTRECSDQDDKSLLQCRVCNKSVNVKTKNGAHNSNNAMLHSLAHLAKPIYRCKQCSETFVTCKIAGLHVRKKHALSATNNYDCSADQYHAEIVEMLRKCYNKETN